MDPIELIVRVDLLAYSLLLAVVILIYINIQYNKKDFSLNLFIFLLSSIAFVTFVEMVTWLVSEVGNGSFISVRYWTNALYFSFIAFPSCLGMMYLDYKIFGDHHKTKRRAWFYFIPFYLSVFVVVLNFFEPGMMFYVSERNVYFRGPLVYISTAVSYGFMLVVMLLFYRHKKLMTTKIIRAMGLYYLIPMVGLAIQLSGYGTTFTMPSHVLGAFLLFLMLEREELFRDPLTNLYSRHNFEKNMLRKINARDPFSILLIDLNDFKLINDNYGHVEGDHALKCVADILMQSSSVEDIVCRYGGDEFIVLIESRHDIALQMVERIEKALERCNEALDFDIGLSYGTVFVGRDNTKSLDEIVNMADKLMYECKRNPPVLYSI